MLTVSLIEHTDVRGKTQHYMKITSETTGKTELVNTGKVTYAKLQALNARDETGPELPFDNSVSNTIGDLVGPPEFKPVNNATEMDNQKHKGGRGNGGNNK